MKVMFIAYVPDKTYHNGENWGVFENYAALRDAHNLDDTAGDAMDVVTAGGWCAMGADDGKVTVRVRAVPFCE